MQSRITIEIKSSCQPRLTMKTEGGPTRSTCNRATCEMGLLIISLVGKYYRQIPKQG